MKSGDTTRALNARNKKHSVARIRGTQWQKQGALGDRTRGIR